MICDRKYTVKICEEESDDAFYEISSPAGFSEEKVERDYQMAVSYAQCCFYDNDREDYDEHFDEVAEFRESSSGEETFVFYLEMLGYEVTPFCFDREFEW